MLAVYIVLGVIGGGLILLSALGVITHGFDASAHFDADHQIDFSHDLSATDSVPTGDNVDHVLHDTGDVWLPFLTLRFWIYTSGCFGLIGFLAAVFSDAREPAIAIVATLAGLLMGFLAAWFYRILPRAEVSGGVSSGDFVGAVGNVLVAVGESKMGKVRVLVKGDTIDMLALAERGTIEVGEEILVTSVEGQKVTVVKKEEYLGE